MGALATRVGVELTATSARAVVRARLGSPPRGGVEVPFDPSRPEAAVMSLRAELGDVGGIALAIGFAHLQLKAVRLPPVDRAQQLAILTLEPDRFFTSNAFSALSLNSFGLACAAEGDAIERWVGAFSAWAPVTAVVDAPMALARALPAATHDGTFVVPAEVRDGECAVIERQDGKIVGARRAAAAQFADGRPLPPAHALHANELVAYGALLSRTARLEEQLLTSSLRVEMGRRRRFVSARWWTVAAAAVIVLLIVVDRARDRALEHGVHDVATLADSAAPALALRQSLAALDRQASMSGLASAPSTDALDVLASLSSHLPTDATVLSLSMVGDEWQIDGRARNATAIVPALDGSRRFQQVRVAGPSTRFTENGRAWETFSVAFRAMPVP